MGKCRAYTDGEQPTNDDCWCASYRWHLSSNSGRARARGGRLPIMLQVVEDNVLGAGQVVEEAMAKEMGAEVVRIPWFGWDVFAGGDVMKQGATMAMQGRLLQALGPYG